MVLSPGVNNVLVDLIGYDEEIGVSTDDVGDGAHLVFGEDLTRRVVRRVEDEEFRTRRDRGLEARGVELPLALALVEAQRDGHDRCTRELHLPVVKIERGLQQQDLLPWVHQRLQGDIEGLRRADGHRHLAHRLDAPLQVVRVPLGQHLDQWRVAGRPRVLMMSTAECLKGLLDDKLRRLPVWEALPEVHSIRSLRRELSKLTPDGRLACPSQSCSGNARKVRRGLN
mmetsp:Transcript_45257/g.96237  ORF Transcript_45257/g.96237 Transcript_45257/m.96237 type:complete len:227 (-) Transcript_45257:195-875(-)